MTVLTPTHSLTDELAAVLGPPVLGEVHDEGHTAVRARVAVRRAVVEGRPV